MASRFKDQVCIICVVFSAHESWSWSLGVCLKSSQQVGVMRASFLDEFQGCDSTSQTLGQQQGRTLVIVWESGPGGKDVYWSSGLMSGRDMGEHTVTKLPFRISLVGCMCLASKVPGHDPVVRILLWEPGPQSLWEKVVVSLWKDFYNLKFALGQPSSHWKPWKKLKINSDFMHNKNFMCC